MGLDVKRVLASAPRKHDLVPAAPLETPWGNRDGQANPLPEHPRPQFARSSYLALHGTWEYAITDAYQTVAITRAGDAPWSFDGQITVPFSPEAPLSGVERQLQPNQLLWYRLSFQVEQAPYTFDGVKREPASSEALPKVVVAQDSVLLVKRGQRCLLHFDGVDHECTVWLNGAIVARHKGAYLPFSADITDELAWGANELLVCVADPSDTASQLRGKQKLEHGDIWYTAQSGIWQPVWLEAVAERRVESLRIHADMHGDLRIEATTSKPMPPMKVALFLRQRCDADSAPASQYDRGTGSASREPLPSGSTATVGKSGIVRFTGAICEDDACRQTASLRVDDARLWSPEEPNLYSIEVRCGEDKIQTYCAFRSVEVKPDAQGIPRFHLNGQPYFLRGVLDQGYWPDGLLTAPSDEALVHDIAAMKGLGFNMLRKHIKVESERWHWHCDRLGMLVWQDMPSGGTDYSTWYTSHQPTLLRASWTRQPDDTPQGQKRLSGGDPALQREWLETCEGMVQRLGNHPCIVTWVLFNEGWGQFDAAAATQLVRELDPTRPIDATSGWYDQACGDYFSVHNYFRPLEVWPDPRHSLQRAFIISEFGGLTWHVARHSAFGDSYGYASFATLDEWRDAVRQTLAQADALEAKGLSGYVYTQLSDVEEETNGLLTYDRQVNKLES